MDSIENRASFDLIRYANCWEDADILCKALEPSEGKRFLSIASAGDNSLSLLSQGAEVVAADLNPSQLACVELRTASIRNLDHDACLEFFGIKPCEKRESLFDKVRKDLSGQSLSYWENSMELIEKGFVHTGKFEHYFYIFNNRIIPLVFSRKTVNKLLEEKSLEERIEFYDAKWDTSRWRMLFKVFFSRFVMGRMGRDPEFFRYVDSPVSTRILERTKYALTRLSTHDNPYLDYILTGNYTHCLPHYLKPENYEKLKKNIDNLHLFEGTVQDSAEKYGEKGFDGFNLSDIFEYLDIPTCRIVYEKLLSKSRGNARFVYWNMLAPRRLSDDIKEVEYLEDLSKDLFAEDKAFFYSDFIVEERK